MRLEKTRKFAPRLANPKIEEGMPDEQKKPSYSLIQPCAKLFHPLTFQVGQ